MLPGNLLGGTGLGPERVVILRASRLGDYIAATPALRAVRHALPRAEITLVGLPIVRELAVRNPCLDRFEEFPGVPGIAEQFFEPQRALEFFARMQARRFDLALQLHGSGVYSNPAALMLGARFTAGMVRPGDPPGRLDAAFPVPEHLHEVRRLLAFLSFLGIEGRGEGLDLPLDAGAGAEAEGVLRAARRPLIGIHAGAREAAKRWPAARFGEAARRLLEMHSGTAVLLGEIDEREARSVRAAIAPRAVLDLTGRTTLACLAAVVARLAVLVTNDSGPAHMAYALRTPSVTIFGATSPDRWGPLEGHHRHAVVLEAVPCRPCGHAECPLPESCLDRLAVADVVAAGDRVMRSAASGPRGGERERPAGLLPARPRKPGSP